MTNKEAFRRIEINLSNYLGEGLVNERRMIRQALTELERLQKKEVPMKVNITNPMDDWHPCPNCGYLVLHSIDKHCSTCGQKLDWSDEK